MDVDTDELARTYSDLADEELLRMHASGQLTEVAYEVLEKELVKRGIPIPRHTEETDAEKKRPLTLRALWKGEASLASAWGLLVALNFLAVVADLIIEDQESPVIDVVGALIALPFAVFALIAIWRCAWNTGWQGWGYISRIFVVAVLVGVLYGWISWFL